MSICLLLIECYMAKSGLDFPGVAGTCADDGCIAVPKYIKAGSIVLFEAGF